MAHFLLHSPARIMSEALLPDTAVWVVGRAPRNANFHLPHNEVTKMHLLRHPGKVGNKKLLQDLQTQKANTDLYGQWAGSLAGVKQMSNASSSPALDKTLHPPAPGQHQQHPAHAMEDEWTSRAPWRLEEEGNGPAEWERRGPPKQEVKNP